MMPDIKLVVCLNVYIVQNVFSCGEHPCPSAPHPDLCSFTQISLDYLTQTVRKFSERVFNPCCIMIPVFIGSDMDYTSGDKRFTSLCVLIPELLRKPESPVRIFSHKIHQLGAAIGSYSSGSILDASFKLWNIIRIFICIFIIKQRMSRKIKLCDHIDPHTAAQRLEFSPFFSCVLRIPLIIFVIEIIIRINGVCRHSRMLYF